MYSVESITTEDGVSDLRKDWDRLSHAARQPNVFATCDWYQVWYRRFAGEEGGGEQRPNILVLKKDGAVTGISPLIGLVSSRFGVVSRKLQFASRNHQWDYNDLVVGDDVEAQTEALIGFLSQSAKAWDLIDLRDLRDAGRTIAHLESALTHAGLSYRLFREEERCPYMRIDRPWSDILGGHSGATRREFRDLRSRLAQFESTSLRVRLIENPHEEPHLLERMIALESRRRIDARPVTPFLGSYADVFECLFARLGQQGWLRVAVTELDDRLLASQVLFVCGKKLWAYVTAYDHEFSRLSPGTMLIPAIVDYAFSNGFTEFDFLNGEESYKLRWATSFHQTYRLIIWNRRWLSRLRAYRNLRVLRSASPESPHSSTSR